MKRMFLVPDWGQWHYRIYGFVRSSSIKLYTNCEVISCLLEVSCPLGVSRASYKYSKRRFLTGVTGVFRSIDLLEMHMTNLLEEVHAQKTKSQNRPISSKIPCAYTLVWGSRP